MSERRNLSKRTLLEEATSTVLARYAVETGSPDKPRDYKIKELTEDEIETLKQRRDLLAAEFEREVGR